MSRFGRVVVLSACLVVVVLVLLLAVLIAVDSWRRTSPRVMGDRAR